jgi:hypothetical protein
MCFPAVESATFHCDGLGESNWPRKSIPAVDGTVTRNQDWHRYMVGLVNRSADRPVDVRLQA